MSNGPGYSVAIKTIKRFESDKEKEKFLTEMKMMSNLMHPNIVRLFGLVQQGSHVSLEQSSYILHMSL